MHYNMDYNEEIFNLAKKYEPSMGILRSITSKTNDSVAFYPNDGVKVKKTISTRIIFTPNRPNNLGTGNIKRLGHINIETPYLNSLKETYLYLVELLRIESDKINILSKVRSEASKDSIDKMDLKSETAGTKMINKGIKLKKLNERLESAVSANNFELACKLRDEIKDLTNIN